MSSEKPAGPAESAPGDGLRSVKTTGVFRAVNFELYVKPVWLTFRTFKLSTHDRVFF